MTNVTSGGWGGEDDLSYVLSWRCSLTPVLSGRWGEETRISGMYTLGDAQ